MKQKFGPKDASRGIDRVEDDHYGTREAVEVVGYGSRHLLQPEDVLGGGGELDGEAKKTCDRVAEIVAKGRLGTWDVTKDSIEHAPGRRHMPYESVQTGMLAEGARLNHEEKQARLEARAVEAGKPFVPEPFVDVFRANKPFKGGGNFFDLAAEIDRCHEFGVQINA